MIFLCTAAVGLAVFISYLLMEYHLAHLRARKEELSQFKFFSQDTRSALENHLENQWHKLELAARDRTVITYLENKALGMSLEYGLRASIASIAIRFSQFAEEGKLDRMMFITEDGNVLVDTKTENVETLTGAECRVLGRLPANNGRLHFDSTRPHQLIMTAPVWHKNKHVGQIAAWLNIDKAGAAISGYEKIYGVSVLIFQKDGRLIFPFDNTSILRSEQAKTRSFMQDAGFGMYREQLPGQTAQSMLVSDFPLSGWPLQIMVVQQASHYISGVKPRYTFIGLTSLAILLSGSLVMIFRSQTKVIFLLDMNRQILESISSILIGVDAEGNVTAWNHVAEEVFGISSRQALGQPFASLPILWDRNVIAREIIRCQKDTRPVQIEELRYTRKNGMHRFFYITINPLYSKEKMNNFFLLSAQDITNQKNLQMQLAQSQRLESVGRLASGIAHEINTPIQFINDNASFLQKGIANIKDCCITYQNLLNRSREGAVPPEALEQIEHDIRSIGMEYLLEEMPKAIEDSIEGIQRITEIVQAMKEFAHPGKSSFHAADLNRAIESTATVARNEWKYVADMVLDLDPSLPAVPCLLAEFNQAVLNIIVNAAQAIAEAQEKGRSQKGTITLRTRLLEHEVEIRVQDTGTGIPEEFRNKIYDPFFTTKDVGKGTGQGLAITYSVIVEKHHGAMTFETDVDVGTTFILRIPIHQEESIPQESHTHEEEHLVSR